MNLFYLSKKRCRREKREKRLNARNTTLQRREGKPREKHRGNIGLKRRLKPSKTETDINVIYQLLIYHIKDNLYNYIINAGTEEKENI